MILQAQGTCFVIATFIIRFTVTYRAACRAQLLTKAVDILTKESFWRRKNNSEMCQHSILIHLFSFGNIKTEPKVVSTWMKQVVIWQGTRYYLILVRQHVPFNSIYFKLLLLWIYQSLGTSDEIAWKCFIWMIFFITDNWIPLSWVVGWTNRNEHPLLQLLWTLCFSTSL